jgi:phosphoenolpyruvate phosphomutase
MKAIILAAGLGTRLGDYTKDLPKSMLNFMGKPLLQRQIDLYRKLGITDITIIREHFGHKINFKDVKYVEGSGPSTNMLVDFFQARKEFDDDIIMSYGDLLLEERVLRRVIESKSVVGVTVDPNWKDYWIARYGSYLEDSESMVIGENDNIISLGISDPKPEEMHARYVGLIKFSKSILPKMEEVYDLAKRDFWEKPWYASKSFKKAYMTDFIQSLIDEGLDVKAIKVDRGWFEFDTVKDYEQAIKWAEEGSLDRFYKLD